VNTRRRDRFVLAGVVVMVLTVAALLVGTVLEAERSGTDALEKLQVSQVDQLTRSMDARVKSIFTSFGGFVNGDPWILKPQNKVDQKRLAGLQALQPQSKTGWLLVDRNGVLTGGTLVRDPAQFGRRVDRAGLDVVLGGAPTITPVGPGVTTALPTVIVGFPIKSAIGAVRGALMIESDISPESAFNAEVAALGRGKTGEFSFIDANGTVLASSDPAVLGKRLDEPLLAGGKAGFQRGDGRVAVSQLVESAGWRTVFVQDVDEFEGALTGPLHSALVYVVITGIVAAGASFIFLARRLQRAREEQRRLEEISAAQEEFISIVSHELRTPVAGLLGFLQTTLDHWTGMAEDERRRSLARALSSARRLHSLTRDVLDSSSIEAGALPYAFTLVDLREEVASAATALRDLAPDREVVVTQPDEAAWVRCDPERIQQVLTNLLDNAVKSSPPLARIEVDVTSSAEQVSVAVRDHGAGLSDEERARVFEKFVRGRSSSTSGTGLGLYICRQIVEAHSGRIHATGAAGGGARFVFELPLVTEPAEPVRA
jgi:signal transduction histidine kinase